MAVSANRLELLQIADAVAREKVIDREIVLAAMADAIQKAARSRYGSETNIRADINSKTGEIRLQRLLEVVEKVEDYATQIALELARDRNVDAKLGDFIADPLPPMDFGRIAAFAAKQVINQRLRSIADDAVLGEFKGKEGDIVAGQIQHQRVDLLGRLSGTDIQLHAALVAHCLTDGGCRAGHRRWLGCLLQLAGNFSRFLFVVYPKGAAQNLIVDGFVRHTVEIFIETTMAGGAAAWAWCGEGVEHVHSRCGCRRPGLAECRFFDIGRVVDALSDF